MNAHLSWNPIKELVGLAMTSLSEDNGMLNMEWELMFNYVFSAVQGIKSAILSMAKRRITKRSSYTKRAYTRRQSG